ncbi:signal peptidase I [Nocardioides humilatus]|uniref:Signal peptidase I n=1 Tax=Nocardioides humilatus TaxID=2607660 RepID=A0A5B1L4A6_9ACTN|nr:signal peptidase I [Nocardioides humilatus]KAA1415335.1 signal peptidase I [Nocardioides humilatus]
MRAALAFVRLVLAWCVILGASSVLLATVVVPRLAGATSYDVQTGSMRPGLPPGTLVVVRPVAPEQIGIGTVVTYQLESGEPTVVTHRVTEIGINRAGERVFRTQGDANDAIDPAPVRPVQVRGALWYSVPYAGHFNDLVTRRSGWPLLAAVIGLLGYAGWMFIGAARDRRATPADAPIEEGELVSS